MLVGLPVSGKSTKAEELAKTYNANIHTSDKIREELGDINNQDNNQLVFQILHNRIKDDLKSGKNCIYNATNINYKRRMDFIRRLNNIPCEKICVLMATPYEECLRNNANRDRKVPEEVIERMYKHFDVPYWYEGWDEIEIEYFPKSKDIFGCPIRWLDEVRDYNQENPHHALTLGEHCETAWKNLCENTTQNTRDVYLNIPLRIASILHDCGKPFTKVFKNSKGEDTEQAHYYSHEHCGSYDSLFYKMICSPLDVAVLVRWHMQMYFIENNEKAINKYKNLWGSRLYQDLFLLHEADKQAH